MLFLLLELPFTLLELISAEMPQTHSSTFILSQAPAVVAYLTVHLPGIYGGIFVGASVVVAHRCHLFHSLGGSFFVDDMCTSSRIFTLFATVGIFCLVN